jgi:hypothetical protein
VRGAPHQVTRAPHASHSHQGKVTLAQVNAICPRGHGDVEVVVDDEKPPRLPCVGRHHEGAPEQLSLLRQFIAQLDDVGPAIDGAAQDLRLVRGRALG